MFILEAAVFIKKISVDFMWKCSKSAFYRKKDLIQIRKNCRKTGTLLLSDAVYPPTALFFVTIPEMFLCRYH